MALRKSTGCATAWRISPTLAAQREARAHAKIRSSSVEARSSARLPESISVKDVVMRLWRSSIFSSRSATGREYQLQPPFDSFKPKAIQSTKGSGKCTAALANRKYFLRRQLVSGFQAEESSVDTPCTRSLEAGLHSRKLEALSRLKHVWHGVRHTSRVHRKSHTSQVP
jgi:hypothetical protein